MSSAAATDDLAARQVIALDLHAWDELQELLERVAL